MTGVLLAAILAAPPARAAAAVAPAAGAAALSTDDRRRALLLLDLLLDDGRLDEADALVNDRLRREPGAPEWTLRLARLRAAQRRYAEAAAVYRSLLKANPDDVGLLLQFGQAEAAAGDGASARTAFERARAVARNPQAPYFLSELAFADGDGGAGLRYAREALALLKTPRNSSEQRMRLRLLTRLAWTDSLDEAYGRLFDAHPSEYDTLVEWADALIRAGFPAAAEEPIALLRERFPVPEIRWRRLEIERLRAAGDEPALKAFLDESARALPQEPSIRLALADLEARDRAWDGAEADDSAALGAPGYERQAAELFSDVAREGHHAAGPFLTLRQSRDTRSLERGASYEGLPAPRLRVDAQASETSYLHYASGRRASLSGGDVGAARETRLWSAGGDVDARAGPGRSFVSPGLSASWRPAEALSISARAWTGRAWKDVPDAALAGAATDSGELSFFSQTLRRLAFGGFAAYRRVALPDGSHARRTELVPTATFTLLDRPFRADLGYQFLAVDASGDASFFSQLPLAPRTRQQQVLLSIGRDWFDRRLHADAYVFNGQNPAQGIRFGTDALVGAGAHVDWLLDAWRLAISYDLTKEDDLGVGGRSQTARASIQYHWAPRRVRQIGEQR